MGRTSLPYGQSLGIPEGKWHQCCPWMTPIYLNSFFPRSPWWECSLFPGGLFQSVSSTHRNLGFLQQQEWQQTLGMTEPGKQPRLDRESREVGKQLGTDSAGDAAWQQSPWGIWEGCAAVGAQDEESVSEAGMGGWVGLWSRKCQRRVQRSPPRSRKAFPGTQDGNVPPSPAKLDVWKASSSFYSLKNVSHHPHPLFEFWVFSQYQNTQYNTHCVLDAGICWKPVWSRVPKPQPF